MNVLVPVQPGSDIRWVSSFLAELRRTQSICAHLLSVQPLYNGHVRMFFSPEQLFAFHTEDARAEAAPLCQALDDRDVPYKVHMAVGSSAEEITRFAKEHACSRIVIGPGARASFSDLLFGSIKRQVEALAQAAGLRCEVL